ncbi:DUF5106 domain-containing protein [Pedobacter sp. AW31-3R]|uniref:DUF5106 domain-containing protein n=1 Tax=Pedobacter sp. AW31-3R TaxID=3445781 RepID=UPI003FA17C94
MNRFNFFKYFLLSPFIVSGIFGCLPDAVHAPGSSAGKASTNTVSKIPKDVLFHYWDDFDFNDTIALNNPEIGEQAVVNFIAALKKFPDTISKRAVKHMLSQAKVYPASLSYFTKQYDHYLYDPNSPMRSDVYYKPVLEFLLDSCQLNDTDRHRYHSLLTLVKKNSAGSPAPDFNFQLPGGNKSSLYDINAPFTLLFFYEPGCPHCEDAMIQLQTTPGFQQLVEKGNLNVLAIYAMGDRNIWKAYQSHIPATWTNGLDKNRQILNQGLYEIRASPTLFLLDKDKVVLLKDADLGQVTSFFKAVI